MKKGSILTLNFQDPREKIIGKLLAISAFGITIKGVDVNSFNDRMKQFTQKQPTTTIFPTTMFFPMHRVVSCYLDEDMGDVPSFSSQFKGRTQKKITEVLWFLRMAEGNEEESMPLIAISQFFNHLLAPN